MYRLILTTVHVTSKMYNETHYTNEYIASKGGVSLQNINELERFFLEMIDWQLFVSPDEYHTCVQTLADFLLAESEQAQASLLPVSSALHSALTDTSDMYKPEKEGEGRSRGIQAPFFPPPQLCPGHKSLVHFVHRLG